MKQKPLANNHNYVPVFKSNPSIIFCFLQLPDFRFRRLFEAQCLLLTSI